MEPQYLFYRGSSMLGTFQPGDKLFVEKVPIRNIRKGDLIIIRKGNVDQNDFVVHRVVKLTSVGLVTRGDHCRQADQDAVTDATFIGRVNGFDRKGGVRRAWNGGMGRLQACRIRARMRVAAALKAFLRKPYRSFRRSEIAARLWRPKLEKIRFETAAGPLIKYIHRGKTVVSYCPDKNLWFFSRPFDLLIDPSQAAKTSCQAQKDLHQDHAQSLNAERTNKYCHRKQLIKPRSKQN